MLLFRSSTHVFLSLYNSRVIVGFSSYYAELSVVFADPTEGELMPWVFDELAQL